MSIFVRSVAGITIVACLFFTVGCESMKIGGKKKPSSGLSLPSWVQKEPEQPRKQMMKDILPQERVKAIR